MPIRFLLSLVLLIAAATALVSPVPQPGTPPRTSEETAVDEPTRTRIDLWIARNKLNPYGDPPDTMYNGGTPLFDERTGVTKDRYAYILERHPELKEDGTSKR